MKRALIVAALLALTGCNNPGADPDAERTDADLRVERIEVDDRTVTCIVYGDGYRGGLSCDWRS